MGGWCNVNHPFKNWVIFWLYSCFVTYMQKKLWNLTRMHRLHVIPVWVQPQATDSAMLTAVMCGVMRVTALCLWCLAFSWQDFCQYMCQPPWPYVPAWVTHGALVAHRYTYAQPRCRTLQYSRTFINFSVSLWNDLASSVFDGVGVGLAGFKSRANASLLA